MAKHDLTLNIGTHYDGEGMKKLDTALKTSAKSVNSASQALGAISNELGQLGGTAGKTANAISGLFSSFMQGGVIGVAIAGITSAIGLVVNMFNKAKETAKDVAQSIADSFSKSSQQIKATVANINAASSGAIAEQQFVGKMVGYSFVNDYNKRVYQINNKAYNDKLNATTPYEIQRIEAKQRQDLELAKLEMNHKQFWQETENLSIEKRIRENELKNLGDQMALNAARQPLGLVFDFANEYNTYNESKAKLQELTKLAGQLGTNHVTGSSTSTVISPTGFSTTVSHDTTVGDEIAAVRENIKKLEDNAEFMAAVKAMEDWQKTQAELQKQAKELSDKLAKIGVELDLRKEAQKTEQKNFQLLYKKVETAYEEEIKQINQREKEEQALLAQRKKAEEERIKAEQQKQKAAEKDRTELEQTRQQQNQRRQALADLENKRKQLIENQNQAARDGIAAQNNLAQAQNRLAQIIQGWQGNFRNPFNVWQNANNAQRQAAQQAQNNANKNQRLAINAANQIEQRIFNADGTIRKGASEFDIGRFAEMSNYLGFTNVGQAQINAMIRLRNQIARRIFDKNGNLKEGVNPLGQDFKLYNQLNENLQSVQQFRDAQKQQQQAQQAANEAKRNQEKAVNQLEQIKQKLTSLEEKAGV